jgi:glucan phosphoethanolaminetransferase (alkaline phosphatase superfamily)
MSSLAMSLFIVLAVAKGATLWGRAVPHSPWALLAFLWQDIAVALCFVLVARVAGRAWIARGVYGALVLLAAINVPIARVLGSPVTAPMIRATRGALGDSVAYHATAGNVAIVLLILALGAALPFVVRPSVRGGRALAVAGLLAIVLGPAAARRVDGGGLERNPLVAIVRTSFPRVGAGPTSSSVDWRSSPAGATESDDLARLRGVAAGRNVLLVVLESTAAQYLRSWGAAEDPTPNLSTLAAQSLVFDNSYAVYPESIKGLAAILASRYPAFDVAAEAHAGAMSPSLATSLTAAGYEAALFHSGRFMYLGMDRILARSGFARMEDAGDIGGNHNSSFGIDEPATVNRVLQWVDAVPRGKQFFAAYLPIAGHHPYTYSGPAAFSAAAETGRYRNALHEGDVAIGALLDGLRARGVLNETLVVVIADHGEAFGQHEGNYGHNLALYDENVRVPLLIALPGLVSAVRHVRRTASLLDIAPTVLDLLGVGRPPEFQGESLLGPRERMALFFTDYSLGLLGLRDGCAKFITELESGRSRLFDLCSDPGERADRAIDRPELVALYRERLRAWSGAQVARVTAGEQAARIARAAIVSGGRFP